MPWSRAGGGDVWDKAVPSLGSRSSSLLDRMNMCRLCRFSRPLPAESRTLLGSRTVPFHVEILLVLLCVALYVCVCPRGFINPG